MTSWALSRSFFVDAIGDFFTNGGDPSKQPNRRLVSTEILSFKEGIPARRSL
ncbi:hypothetical protein [Leptospirillum ferriphilum]|jgi:hypothetical protein|uniref:hypothetical protein n=1 Tax=Leptospirillum ferriphilum TaxID=178606 RepID=UPI000A978C64|nr:hypothetical protein [Leptospirillum ferriphilum]